MWLARACEWRFRVFRVDVVRLRAQSHRVPAGTLLGLLRYGHAQGLLPDLIDVVDDDIDVEITVGPPGRPSFAIRA